MGFEVRTIEKLGILKLLPEDRGALKLIVSTEVIQLPFHEYRNFKSNPPKGHYGYATLMDGEFVLKLIDLQFRRQLIVDHDNYVVQLAWQEFCNSQTILDFLGPEAPDTTVEYPIWRCNEIRFELEPGVVLRVFKSSLPMVICEGSGISQPNLTELSPHVPGDPPAPPAETAPSSTKIPLSAPYEGTNDDGNTFVRGQGATPAPGSCATYRIAGTYRYGNSFGGAGGPFTITVDATAGSFRAETGDSNQETYLFYKPCGSQTETIVTNGFGGITPSYTVTPI
jgi:hypothetical protein